MTMLLAIICAAVAIAAVAAAVILVARHHRKTTDDSGHENHSGDVAYEPAAGVVILSRTEKGNDGILVLYDGLTQQSMDHTFYTVADDRSPAWINGFTLIGFVDDNTSVLVAHENGKQIDTLKIVGGKMSISDDTNDTFQLSEAGAGPDSVILFGLVSPSGRYVFIQCVESSRTDGETVHAEMCYWDRQQQRKSLLPLLSRDNSNFRFLAKPVFDKNDQLLMLSHAPVRVSAPWSVNLNNTTDNRLHVFAPGEFETYFTLTDAGHNRDQNIRASSWMCDGTFVTVGTYANDVAPFIGFVIQMWNYSESKQVLSTDLTAGVPNSASRVANFSFDSQFENYMVAFDTGTVNLYHSNNNLAAVCLLPDDTSDDTSSDDISPDDVFSMFSPDDKMLLVLASTSQPRNQGSSTIDVCRIVLYNVSGAFDDANQTVTLPEGTVVPQGSNTTDGWNIDNVWFVNSNRFCAAHDDGLGVSIIETEISTDGTINYTVKTISEGTVDELMTTVARERLFR